MKNGKKIHGKKYDYSNILEIKNTKTKLDIKCKKHKRIFTQSYDEHIYKQNGCPNCSESKGEQFVREYLENNNIECNPQKVIKFLGKQHKFDFYIKNKNLFIEYDGIQHFKENPFFQQTIYDQRNSDSMKNAYVCNKNCNLIRIHHMDLKKIDKVLDKYLPKCNKKTSQIYFSRDDYT